MDEKAVFFSILCICFMMLPYAIMNWREGNKRIYKHVLYWTIIMLMFFLITKTIKGTFIPDEQSARPRGALIEDTDPASRRKSQLRPSPL